MYDPEKHEIGYLQVWSHMRRMDKHTGKWVLVPNTNITRKFANKKHYGWVSILDPELTTFRAVMGLDDYDGECYNKEDSNSDEIDEQFQ